MMMTPFSPQRPALPVSKPLPRPAFGSCVQARMSAGEMEALLIKGSFSERYHYIREMGAMGTEDAVTALINLVQGKDKLVGVIKDPSNEAQQLTIVALVKQGLKRPGSKARIIEALKEAKKKPHMRDAKLQKLIDNAIAQLEHGEKPSEAFNHAEHVFDHHHAGSQHQHH